MLNLDTHILIHALKGSVTPKERSLLSRHEWGISAIVLWEMAKLVELGRIEMDLDDGEVVRVLTKIIIWPLDLAVCRRLKHLDFKSDPADEIIACTSLEYKAPLMTRDKVIRKSKVVPLASA